LEHGVVVELERRRAGEDLLLLVLEDEARKEGEL
jgi:hypothetical protein